MPSNNWENINNSDNFKNKKSKSFGFYFLILSIICFLVMVVFAGTNYYFKQNYISSDNIIFTNNIVDGYEAGTPKQLVFKIENKNKLDIRNVKLSFEYEKGRKVDGEYNIEKQTFSFGDVLAGANVSTTTEILFLGKEGETRNVYSVISYDIKNGNTYQKSITDPITISSALVTVDFSSDRKDQSVIFNDKFVIRFKIKNNSKEILKNTSFDIDLPYGFVVTSLTNNQNNFTNNTNTNANNSNVNTKIVTKNIILPKIDPYQSINYNLVGYLDGKKIGENIFRLSIFDNKDDFQSLILSDTYIINTIESIFSYNFDFKINNSSAKELINGQQYASYLTLKNNSDHAFDNLLVELTSGSNTVIFDYKNNTDLIRINPNNNVLLYFDFTAKEENSFTIKVYGNKKGDTENKLIMNEKYKI